MMNTKQKLTLKERIVKNFMTYFEEHGVGMACGMLMLSGNTSGVLAYPMLKK